MKKYHFNNIFLQSYQQSDHSKRNDSHLFDMAIILGSVTSICQTTACQASAWGVIVSALWVGIMMQASATVPV